MAIMGIDTVLYFQFFLYLFSMKVGSAFMIIILSQQAFFSNLSLSAKRKALHTLQGTNISHLSGDSGMYPYQRTPMGNPYISPI